MKDTGIMFKYERSLKTFSRDLRKNMTEAELLLWSRLRNRQVLGVRFYRQRPFLNYILDFYCFEAQLAIECDGSQHYEKEHSENDQVRDNHLRSMGLKVLRFSNNQIIRETDTVMQVIFDAVSVVRV